MSVKIEIVKQIDAETRERWGFLMFEVTAVFVGWHKETKPKGKRNWLNVAFWDKYARMDYRMADEPKIPESMKAEVIQEITELLKVKSWDEWKNPELTKI